MRKAVELEQKRVLDDILVESGCQLEAIVQLRDVPSPRLQSLLPLLFRWAEQAECMEVRMSIYFSIASASLTNQIDRLLQLWQRESDPIAKSVLTTVIASCATRREPAEKIWGVVRSTRDYALRSFLLAKLSRRPSIADEVAEEIVDHLESGTCVVGDWEIYQALKHPLVASCVQRLRPGDGEGKRGRRPAMPACLSRSRGPNDSQFEYAEEFDALELPERLQRIEELFGIAISIDDPAAVIRFLSRTPAERWFALRSVLMSDGAKAGVRVLLRSEDVDVIHVVVERGYLNGRC